MFQEAKAAVRFRSFFSPIDRIVSHDTRQGPGPCIFSSTADGIQGVGRFLPSDGSANAVSPMSGSTDANQPMPVRSEAASIA